MAGPITATRGGRSGSGETARGENLSVENTWRAGLPAGSSRICTSVE
jgi:hypothetical protein